MSFIARWLNLTRDRRPVGLRPHREIELDAGYDDARARVLQGIEVALGAYVAANRDAVVEAAFGLVNNERVRCTLERSGETQTRVRIEAYFPAGSAVREHSRAVEVLADYLASTSKRV